MITREIGIYRDSFSIDYIKEKYRTPKDSYILA